MSSSQCPCIPCTSKEKKQEKKILRDMANKYGVSVDKINIGYAGGVNFRRIIKTPKSTRAARAAKRNNNKERGGGLEEQVKKGYNYVKGCVQTCCRKPSESLSSSPHSSSKKGHTSSPYSMGPPPGPPPNFSENVMPENLKNMKHIFNFDPYYDNKIAAQYANNVIAQGEDVGKYVVLDKISEFDKKVPLNDEIKLNDGETFLGYNQGIPVIRNVKADTHRFVHHGTDYESFRRGIGNAHSNNFKVNSDQIKEIDNRMHKGNKLQQEWNKYGDDMHRYSFDKRNEILANHYQGLQKKNPDIRLYDRNNPNDIQRFHEDAREIPREVYLQGGKILTTKAAKPTKAAKAAKAAKPAKATKAAKPTKPTKAAKTAKAAKPTKAAKAAKAAKTKKPKAIKIRKPPKTLRTKKAAPRKNI